MSEGAAADTAEWKPRLIETLGGGVYCHYCLHRWRVHNGAGECLRSDRRTRSGYCNCSGNRRPSRSEAT